MFRGINLVNLDGKGRVAMPARYRAELEEQAAGKLVITIDAAGRCLLLYPLPVWELIEEKLEKLPSFNLETRRIQRLLIGHATELELDGNGRVLLPPLLRNYAFLDKQVMLVGQGKKFELWDKRTWEQQREEWLSKTVGMTEQLPKELQALSL